MEFSGRLASFPIAELLTWAANDRRTGVWAARLEPGPLLAAVREGRTFSTDDRDASIRLRTEDGLWMGSTVTRPGPRLAQGLASLARAVHPELELAGFPADPPLCQPG